ncbi:MAG TPA: hypothetical protein VKQ30_24985 [Ktedonobacterales bacterium]|nr:hypothetical protein [Ktedonobacterales bacterium]
MIVKLVAVVLIVVGLALLPLSVLSRVRGAVSDVPPPPLPVGHELARPGATLENGWAIANISPCTFLDVYQKAANVLGEPVSGFDGVAQWFEYAQLICQPNNPPGQQVVLANLGYSELRSLGKIPQPGAPLAPAPQDFILLSLGRGGIDPQTYFGEPISPPLCDTKTNQCVQYLEKTALSFDQSAASGEQVNRQPLGLWQSHAETRPAYVRARAVAAQRKLVRWPFLLTGLGCLVAGLLLLLWQQFGQGLSSGAVI